MDVWDESPLPPPRAAPQDPAAQDPTAQAPGIAAAPPTVSGADPQDQRLPFRRVAGVPVWILAALAATVSIVVAAAAFLPSDGATTAPGTAGATPPRLSPPPAAAPAPAAVITNPQGPTMPATTPAATDSIASVPSSTAPAAPVASTATTPTTTAATAAATTPTTTAATTAATTPTTTAAAAAPTTSGVSGIAGEWEPTTVVDGGRSLTVTPRRDACRSGPECLVVAFTIDGFSNRPDEFVCEFSSGARFRYRFSGTGVETACSTIDVPDSILVEVDGLRSEPVPNTN